MLIWVSQEGETRSDPGNSRMEGKKGGFARCIFRPGRLHAAGRGRALIWLADPEPERYRPRRLLPEPGALNSAGTDETEYSQIVERTCGVK
jgi:hypothetical protein